MERALFIYKQTIIEVKYSVKVPFDILEVNQNSNKMYFLTMIFFLVIIGNARKNRYMMQNDLNISGG